MIFSSINMFIVYMSYTSCKWSTIFRCNFNTSITTCIWYISCYKNICIWLITKTCFNNFCFKLNAWIIFISFTIFCVILIIDNMPFSCCKFWRFIIIITQYVYNLLSFQFYTWSKSNNCSSILWKFKSCFFWLFNYKKIFCSSISLKSSNKINFSTALTCGYFLEKNWKKHSCRHDKNYYYVWKSNIHVINFIVDSRNMIKASKSMSFTKYRQFLSVFIVFEWGRILDSAMDK